MLTGIQPRTVLLVLYTNVMFSGQLL